MSWEATGTVNRPTSSRSIDQLKADGPKLLHFIHSDKNHLERWVFLSGVLGQNQRDLDKLSLPPSPCIYQWCEKQAWDNEKWSCWGNQASLTTLDWLQDSAAGESLCPSQVVEEISAAIQPIVSNLEWWEKPASILMAESWQPLCTSAWYGNINGSQGNIKRLWTHFPAGEGSPH